MVKSIATTLLLEIRNRARKTISSTFASTLFVEDKKTLFALSKILSEKIGPLEFQEDVHSGLRQS